MILGRSTVLWLALVAAALNVATVVFGINLSPDQIVALNAFAFAFVGFLANEADPTTVGTFALTTKAPTHTQSKHTTAS